MKNDRDDPELTPRMRRVLAIARRLSDENDQDYIGVEHVLLAMLLEGNSIATDVLRELRADKELERRLKAVVDAPPKTTNLVVNKSREIVGRMLVDDAGALYVEREDASPPDPV